MTSGLSRRTALGAGAAALGAAAVGTAAPAQAQQATRTAAASTPSAADSGLDPATPVRSQFLGREGTAYDGASQWSAHRLELAVVGDLPGDGDAEHRFAVRFTTDDAARDGIYRLTAPGEPDAILYLTRVGGGAPTLEGVVDRRAV
ncbi:hypothetical protein ACFOE1_08990 [Agromyces mediolanus]|uniref:Uncharacterized protein n=1 Tax=Agromyces mediolanus TaxID=41986 RepID=A0A918F9P4_AGRME|nr:hypothetical protein [Agromyces mediolanus]GGR18859.1 hypothetical protein GCM10010196_10010 [Agromyces mediolanus]GLJ71384.1 hypothetical protein GCM10017583_06400 [Agromyces mediolanus]